MAPAARFSLYCLEEGEEYLDEAIATYYPPLPRGRHLPLQRRPRHSGRLRLCSNSIFFEPDDLKEPLFRFRLQDLEEREIAGAMNPPGTEAANLFLFHCTPVTQLLQHGRVRPHVPTTAPGQHLFSLTFLPLDAFLTPLNAVLRMAQLPAPQRDAEVRRLVQRRDATYAFDFGWLQDPSEEVQFEHLAVAVLPLVRVRGRVLVTDQAVYFQAFSDVSAAPIQRLPRPDLVQVERRRFLLRDVGLELQGRSPSTTLFIAFDREEAAVCTTLYELLTGRSVDAPEARPDLEAMTLRWQHQEVSNFDYLMFLNSVAGRSVNDLSQYPVLPWVLADYESSTLDLGNPAVYRDLSKPVGALNPERLAGFKARMAQMAQMAEACAEPPSPPGPDSAESPGPAAGTPTRRFLAFLTRAKTPSPEHVGEEARRRRPASPTAPPTPCPFLYGTHYSTPGYVVFFLVRQHPEYMLLLQRGRYDAPDRLFDSVPTCWRSVTTLSTDLKELIPEFYSGDAAFLSNQHGYDLGLGVKQDGTAVREAVELPPWAHGDPHEFLRLQRAALEGAHASAHLHSWIDLVFGCLQRGPAARDHDNLFHPLTYEAPAPPEGEDEAQGQARELQVQEFGQTPRQLFRRPHPPRLPAPE
eukprot:EG_transcript_4406